MSSRSNRTDSAINATRLTTGVAGQPGPVQPPGTHPPSGPLYPRYIEPSSGPKVLKAPSLDLRFKNPMSGIEEEITHFWAPLPNSVPKDKGAYGDAPSSNRKSNSLQNYHRDNKQLEQRNLRGDVGLPPPNPDEPIQARAASRLRYSQSSKAPVRTPPSYSAATPVASPTPPRVPAKQWGIRFTDGSHKHLFYEKTIATDRRQKAETAVKQAAIMVSMPGSPNMTSSDYRKKNIDASINGMLALGSLGTGAALAIGAVSLTTPVGWVAASACAGLGLSALFRETSWKAGAPLTSAALEGAKTIFHSVWAPKGTALQGGLLQGIPLVERWNREKATMRAVADQREKQYKAAFKENLSAAQRELDHAQQVEDGWDRAFSALESPGYGENVSSVDWESLRELLQVNQSPEYQQMGGAVALAAQLGVQNPRTRRTIFRQSGSTA